MTQPPLPPSRSSTGSITSWIVGLVAGFVIGGVISAAGAFLYAQKLGAEAREGWNLVPVIVARVDIPEGTTVSTEMLSQRSIPEQFVTSSIVKPNGLDYIVSQKLLVPVQAGDPLLWTQFETRKQSAVLVAARDLGVGVNLTEADVEARPYPEELLTESFIANRDRPFVVGQAPAAPFRKGDPLLWTHFRPGLRGASASGSVK